MHCVSVSASRSRSWNIQRISHINYPTIMTLKFAGKKGRYKHKLTQAEYGSTMCIFLTLNIAVTFHTAWYMLNINLAVINNLFFKISTQYTHTSKMTGRNLYCGQGKTNHWHWVIWATKFWTVLQNIWVSNKENASCQRSGIYGIDVGPGIVQNMCTTNLRCRLSVRDLKTCTQFWYEPE